MHYQYIFLNDGHTSFACNEYTSRFEHTAVDKLEDGDMADLYFAWGREWW